MQARKNHPDRKPNDPKAHANFQVRLDSRNILTIASNSACSFLTLQPYLLSHSTPEILVCLLFFILPFFPSLLSDHPIPCCYNTCIPSSSFLPPYPHPSPFLPSLSSSLLPSLSVILTLLPSLHSPLPLSFSPSVHSALARRIKCYPIPS